MKPKVQIQKNKLKNIKQKSKKKEKVSTNEKYCKVSTLKQIYISMFLFGEVLRGCKSIFYIIPRKGLKLKPLLKNLIIHNLGLSMVWLICLVMITKWLEPGNPIGNSISSTKTLICIQLLKRALSVVNLSEAPPFWGPNLTMHF